MSLRRPRQVDWLAGDPRFDWEALNSAPLRLPAPEPPPLEPAINPSAPYELGVIACSASKRSVATAASDLYTGALFRLALAVARRHCRRVRILSAKHGAVRLETVLEPYDASLVSLPKHLVAIWGARVGRELEAWKGRPVLCLASAPYWRPVYGAGTWHRPLVGLGIGQQKARLAELLEATSVPATPSP